MMNHGPSQPAQAFLIEASEQLAAARSMDEVVEVLRHKARAAIGAEGFAAIVREEGCCFYAAEDAIAPWWTGSRSTRTPAFGAGRCFISKRSQSPTSASTPLAARRLCGQLPPQHDDETVRRLQSLTRIAAIAIENARLQDAIRRAVAGTGLEVFAVSERSFVIRAPSASRPLPTPSAAMVMQPMAAYQPSAPRAESAAQAAPETPSGGDIIVTAQKRAERIQDVPLAVTALSGASLANHQINDTTTLVKAVPSLTFQAGNNPSNNSFRIRGVGTAIFSLGVEPSVSVVVDGVVQARQAQNFADLADIERVEVLRGPQGTLFGKNATAGVINVVTARPSHTWTAQSSATVAQENEYRFSGSLSGPLSETLRMRITGFGNDIGGYQTNVSDGSKRGGSHGWGVRGKLEWDASDRLNLLASAEYRMNDATCCSYILANAQNPLRAALYNGAGVPVSATTDLVWNSGKSYANSDQQTYSLQATYDLDWATITSVSAYQYFNIDTNFEADRLGSSVPIYLSPTSNALFDYNVATTRTNQLSQELRLDSKAGERLTYTVGGYYSHLILDRPSARRRVVCSSGTVGQPCAASTISYQSLERKLIKCLEIIAVA